MDKREAFSALINEGYACKGDSILLGGVMLDGQPVTGTQVKIPLKIINRHGLIAGATGMEGGSPNALLPKGPDTSYVSANCASKCGVSIIVGSL